MRAHVLSLALAAAAPAAAQPLPVPPASQAQLQMQQNALAAQQALAQQQQIALQNELAARDAQLRADAAVASLQAQVQPMPVSPPNLAAIAAGAQPPKLDPGAFPRIPDAALAASNQRVLDAARPRD